MNYLTEEAKARIEIDKLLEAAGLNLQLVDGLMLGQVLAEAGS